MTELKHDIGTGDFYTLMVEYAGYWGTKRSDKAYEDLKKHISDFVEKRIGGESLARYVRKLGLATKPEEALCDEMKEYQSLPDDRVIGTSLSTGEKIRMSDMWGMHLTSDDINNTNFGVKTQQKRKENKMSLRLVQYYVVDPDLQLPDDMHILDEGTATIRDETEFKVGLDLPGLLEHHNKNRTTVEYELRDSAGDILATKTLKAAKIRDLRIIINTVDEWC